MLYGMQAWSAPSAALFSITNMPMHNREDTCGMAQPDSIEYDRIHERQLLRHLGVAIRKKDTVGRWHTDLARITAIDLDREV